MNLSSTDIFALFDTLLCRYAQGVARQIRRAAVIHSPIRLRATVVLVSMPQLWRGGKFRRDAFCYIPYLYCICVNISWKKKNIVYKPQMARRVARIWCIFFVYPLTQNCEFQSQSRNFASKGVQKKTPYTVWFLCRLKGGFRGVFSGLIWLNRGGLSAYFSTGGRFIRWHGQPFNFCAFTL